MKKNGKIIIYGLIMAGSFFLGGVAPIPHEDKHEDKEVVIREDLTPLSYVTFSPEEMTDFSNIVDAEVFEDVAYGGRYVCQVDIVRAFAEEDEDFAVYLEEQHGIDPFR